MPLDPWFRTAAPLCLLSATLVAASLLSRLLAYRAQLADPEAAPGLAVRLFDVNSERNVPTAWSTGLLLVAALLALRLATRDRVRARGWAVLSAVVALLAVDEGLALHERLGDAGRAVAGSALHFAWVVPGVALGLLLAVAAATALRRHEVQVRRRLLLVAAVYGLGAVVAETVSGLVLRAYGDREGYVAVTAVEEGLEMLALSLLVALLVDAGRRLVPVGVPAQRPRPAAVRPRPGALPAPP